jgi:hypothetical protein
MKLHTFLSGKHGLHFADFKKLIGVHQHYFQIPYTEFHLLGTMNRESTDEH